LVDAATRLDSTRQSAINPNLTAKVGTDSLFLQHFPP
jgi:hypothetical protein